MSKAIDLELLKSRAYDLNLTTYELGRQTQMPQSTISAILLGRTTPSALRLKAICDVLDIDINEAFISEPVKKAA